MTLIPIDAETVALAGSNIAAAFDCGIGAKFGKFVLSAVLGDGRPIGVRIRHGSASTVAALVTDSVVCEHGQYEFTCEPTSSTFLRYIDILTLADDTRVTLSRMDGWHGGV